MLSKASLGQRKRREREKNQILELYNHQSHPHFRTSSVIGVGSIEETNLHASPPVIEFLRSLETIVSSTNQNHGETPIKTNQTTLSSPSR